MSDSMSMLQLVTAMGWLIATCRETRAAQAGGEGRRGQHGQAASWPAWECQASGRGRPQRARSPASSEPHLVERAHGGKAQHGLGGGEEELQHGDRGGQLPRGDVPHVADGARRLKDDHLALVPQAALQEAVEGAQLGAHPRLALRNHLRGREGQGRAHAPRSWCQPTRAEGHAWGPGCFCSQAGGQLRGGNTA